MKQRFDLDAIKAQYDMRQVYPVSSRRRPYSEYVLELCIFHDDSHPSMLVGRNWYKCKTCDAKGDIFTWVMNTGGTFAEAAQGLQDGTVNLNMVPGPYIERPKLPAPIFRPDEPTDYVTGMAETDYVLLAEQTGIERATAVEHMIGRYDYGVYTIPVKSHTDDSWGNIRLYRPKANKQRGEIKSWSIKEGAPNMLYGLPYLNGDNYAVIVGGEKDTILGHQMHLPFVTTTAGENSWDEEFNALLLGRKILYSFLDADATGRAGTRRIRKKAPRTIPCDWKLLWSPRVPPGYDFDDFRRDGGTREQFLQMLSNAIRGLYGKPLLEPKFYSFPETSAQTSEINMQEGII